MTKEILEIEQNREDIKARCVIHLFKEGTFLRAYNWSAWLCWRYLHEFKINKRKVKNVEFPVVYIGFPETSLAKWIPENSEPVVESEKHYTLYLSLDESDSLDDVMNERYKEWYDSIPLTENKRKEKDSISETDNCGSVSISSVIQRIISFPVESKSPIDCMLFIAEIKKDISKII